MDYKVYNSNSCYHYFEYEINLAKEEITHLFALKIWLRINQE